MNNVILSGYVGSDPKFFNSGDNKIARVSIATKRYANKKEVSDWHNVELFGGLAEYVNKYVKKGDYIVIGGFLSTSNFKTKSGEERSVYSVKATSIDKARITTNAAQHDTQSDDDDVPYDTPF